MKTSACTILTVLLATPPGAIPSHALQQEAAAMRQEAKEPQRQDGTAPPERRDAPSVSFGLEDATPVKLGTARELSSASDRTGDRVDFEVLEDVCAKNVVIIPKGGIA